MVHRQDVQQRLFDAISSNVGVDRLPSVLDRDRLDLVEATVLELLRYISHVPLGLPHYTTADTSVAGFFVDKHIKVVAYIASCVINSRQCCTGIFANAQTKLCGLKCGRHKHAPAPCKW